MDDVTQNVLLAIHRAPPIVVPEGRSPEQAWRAWCRGVVRIQVARHRRDLWHSLPGEVDPSVSVDPSLAVDVTPSTFIEVDPSMPVGLDPSDVVGERAQC